MVHRLGFFLVTLSIALSSCIGVKQVKYVQQAAEAKENSISIPVYKVRVQDKLYVKILSLDEKAFSFFNNADAIRGGQYTTDLNLYLNSYEVADSGYITLPVIGELYVKDKTIDEVKALIEVSLAPYLTQFNVIVKFLDFKVTLLGEVIRPGQYPVYANSLTIFQALGLAGDLTDYANRKQITLIRETASGKVIQTINLLDKNLLSSSYYYLQPNDVLVASPLKAKSFAARSFSIGTLLSSVTTLILVLNYIN